MNARKSMSLIGAAIVIGVGVSIPHAFAGIDRGGKPVDGDGDGNTVSQGPVTAFGSIYVNGVRYRTESAVFLIDGSLGSERDLSVGRIVTVYGQYDEATGEGFADVVVSETAVEGPISLLDPSGERMSVLGQTVYFDSDTAWALSSSNRGINDLGAGDVVAISGYRNADGDIVATLVSDRLSDGDLDVTGAIGKVDSAATTFWIDGLSVDYGSANLFGLAGGMPTTGQRVDVTGATFNKDGQLVATSVAADDNAIAAEAGTAAEIEGLVTAMLSADAFDIGGNTVRFGANTRFVGGANAGLAVNVRLEAEGSFDADGVLVADTIRFERPSTLEASGYVETVSDGTLVIGGTYVIVTPKTAWQDASAENDRQFGISAVRTGDYVTVRGHGSGGNITATRVEREDPRPRFDWNDNPIAQDF